MLARVRRDLDVGLPTLAHQPKVLLEQLAFPPDLGQVGDLTGAFVYLASDASSLMTGTSMIIDGGWTAD